MPATTFVERYTSKREHFSALSWYAREIMECSTRTRCRSPVDIDHNFQSAQQTHNIKCHSHLTQLFIYIAEMVPVKRIILLSPCEEQATVSESCLPRSGTGWSNTPQEGSARVTRKRNSICFSPSGLTWCNIADDQQTCYQRIAICPTLSKYESFG